MDDENTSANQDPEQSQCEECGGWNGCCAKDCSRNVWVSKEDKDEYSETDAAKLLGTDISYLTNLSNMAGIAFRWVGFQRYFKTTDLLDHKAYLDLERAKQEQII